MKKYLLSMLLVAIIVLCMGCTISYGACSAQSKTVNSGEDFSITVTSSKGLEDYGLKLISYNGLTFKSCSGGSFANNGKISYAVVGSPIKTLGTFNFKAPDVKEDKTYKITFNVETDKDETVTSTITVKAPKVAEETKPTETEKPAEETKPTETEKPAEETKPAETEKPAEETKPAETEKPAEETKPAETEKPSEETKPAETEKPVEETKPAEQAKPTETKEPEKKSNNANLSNLGITPHDFTGFKSSNTSYNVSVPNDVTTIEVYAKKGDEKQTITGTGKKNLSEGSNPYDIVVTAEDGTQKVYRVNVIRLAKEEINNPDVENPESKVEVALASLQIVSVTLNEPFKPDVYEYTATANADAKEVIVSGSANIENAIVDIESPEEFEDGENIIKITVREKDGDNKKVYTVKVNKAKVEKEVKTENTIPALVGKTNNKNNQNNSGISKGTIIYCVGISVVALLGIIFAFIRYKKDKKEEEEYNDIDFVGDISPKDAVIDAAIATTKLSNSNAEIAEETGVSKKKGKHF